MDKYIVIHEHKYGTEVYILETSIKQSKSLLMERIDDVIDLLNIEDFDPDRESITIEEFPERIHTL